MHITDIQYFTHTLFSKDLLQNLTYKSFCNFVYTSKKYLLNYLAQKNLMELHLSLTRPVQIVYNNHSWRNGYCTLENTVGIKFGLQQLLSTCHVIVCPLENWNIVFHNIENTHKHRIKLTNEMKRHFLF